MDNYQLYFIPVIISTIVTLIIWLITYITPYIWPETYSKFILFLRSNDPTDLTEISLIISQFLKYDDWKRLVAKERLKRIFKRKIQTIEHEQMVRWEELKSNSTYIPLKQVIKSLKEALDFQLPYEDDEKDRELLISKTYLDEAMEKMDKKEIEKELKKYSEIIEGNKNAKIWFLIDEDLPLGIKGKISDYKKPLTTRELAVLISLRYPRVDMDGTWDKEKFLKIMINEKPPEKYDDENLDDIFQNIILYLEYMDDSQQKSKEQILRLALGLSNHEKSSETLMNLIKKVKKAIYKKEFAEIKSKLGLMYE